MATAREELHLLTDTLPDSVVEELAALARELGQQVENGGVGEVADPEEIAIVLDALRDDGTEPELTAEEAKAYLAECRRLRLS